MGPLVGGRGGGNKLDEAAEEGRRRVRVEGIEVIEVSVREQTVNKHIFQRIQFATLVP